MKTMTRILMIDGAAGAWIDDRGRTQKPPEIAIATGVKLRFDLRQPAADVGTGEKLPVDIDDIRCDSYCLAIDNDYDPATAPKLLRVNGFTLTEADGRTYLEVEIPNTAYPGLMEAVALKGSIELKAELSGYIAREEPPEAASAPAASFAVGFPLVIRNRVYLGGGDVPPEVVHDPEYLTAVQIHALIASYTRPEKGNPGADGRGIVSIVKTSAEELVDTYTVTFTDNTTQTVSITNGKAGEPGRGILSIGKTAMEENVDTYTIAYTDGTEQVFTVINGVDGAPGQGLKLDAVGQELNERFAYGDKPAGFSFGCSVVDMVNQNTKMYVFLKRSGEANDWSEPMIITWFGREPKDGANIALIPPLEFTTPPAGTEYLTFDISKHPSATIGAVCIDIAEGEYRLPYDSALGIRKILKKDGKYYVYFGNLCPAFETGRIYFTQGASGLDQYHWYLRDGGTLSFEDWYNAIKNLVPEAPVNGKFYARCNKRWVDITDVLKGLGELPEVPDPPGDDEWMYYGYVPYEVAGNITKVTQITNAMLEHENSSIVAARPEALAKASLGVVPGGAWVVVLVPAIAGLTACKINDITGKSEFYLDNGATGTGANGAAVTLNNIAYEVYGEFKINTAELFICVEYK